MTALLSVHDVGFRYRAVTAVQNVSFELGAGVTALVGVNGAGKTTLLNLLATRSQPATGSITYAAGQRVPGATGRDLVALRRGVSMAPQEIEIPRVLRVDDFMRYMAWARAVPRAETDREIGEALAAVDLSGRRHSRVGSLSGGMRRRLNLGQALLGRPRLVLLDEPFAGLDPEQRASLREQIGGLETRAAVVISSHELQDVALIAERVLMLDAGRVAFDGTRSELEEVGRATIAPGSAVSPLEAAFLAIRQQGARP